MTVVRYVLALVLVVMIGLSPAPAAAIDAGEARKTVQGATVAGLATFTGKTYPLAERSRLLEDLLRRYTDQTLLSASILGRYWPRLTPAEQAAFSDLFLRYLVSSYVGLLRNLEPGLTIEIGAAEDLGPKARVLSTAHLPSQPGAPVPVEWEVAATSDGRLVIMDFAAQGISLIRAMHDDFASVMRSSGGKIEPLMDALRRKIDANDQANAATG